MECGRVRVTLRADGNGNVGHEGYEGICLDFSSKWGWVWS